MGCDNPEGHAPVEEARDENTAAIRLGVEYRDVPAAGHRPDEEYDPGSIVHTISKQIAVRACIRSGKPRKQRYSACQVRWYAKYCIPTGALPDLQVDSP